MTPAQKTEAMQAARDEHDKTIADARKVLDEANTMFAKVLREAGETFNTKLKEILSQ